MLLVFHSKAAADVLMLSRHVAPMLRAAGKGGATSDQDAPARGVFTAAQLPAVIAAIERAVEQEAAPMEPVEEPDADAPVPAMAQPVSLRVRAYPLLDMLRRAQKKGVDVLWEAA